MPMPFDVVLAYVRPDREWAMALADRLEALGLIARFDEWTADGDVVVHGLDEGARRGAPAAIGLSPAMLEAPFAGELHRVLLDGALAGGRRMVPVVAGQVTELPSLLESRPWVDVRDAPQLDREAELFRLVQLLKGERPSLHPRVGGAPAERGGRHLAPARPRRRLVVGGGRATLCGAASGAPTSVAWSPAGTPLVPPPELASALRAALEARAPDALPLELVLDLADAELEELDWEGLRLDGAPLVRDGRVELLRGRPPRLSAISPRTAPSLDVLLVAPGPRIRRDPRRVPPERMLKRALDAIEPALEHRAVRLVTPELASERGLRAAVRERRPAVVVLAAELDGGEVLLDTEEGTVERLGGAELARALEIEEGGVPALVLLPGVAEGARPDVPALEALRFVEELLARGLPAALVGPSTDPDASPAGDRIVAATLVALAEDPGIDLITAVARARRGVGAAEPAALEGTGACLVGAGRRAPPWLRGRAEPPARTPASRSWSRAGRTRLVRALRQYDRAGVLLHGPPASGVSELAHRLVDALRDDEWIPVRLEGPLTPDEILAAVSERISLRLDAEDRPPDDPMRPAAAWLGRSDRDWAERIARLESEALKRMPVVVLLDGFEHNLDEHGRVESENLRVFLDSWLSEPGRTRLVAAVQRPLPATPPGMQRLLDEAVGGLDDVEARLAMACLDGLRLEPPGRRERVRRAVGALPEALALVDAHLRAGGALDDLLERLEEPAADAAEPRGGREHGLEDLVAAVLALRPPLARELLEAAATLRIPVARTGLAWLVGAPASASPDPERERRLDELDRKIRGLRARGEAPTVQALGLDAHRLRRYERDIAARLEPPVTEPPGFDAALAALRELGLIRVLPGHEGGEELHRVSGAVRAAFEVAQADAARGAARHERAASYFLWRVEVLPRPVELDLPELVEARHHLARAGRTASAVEVSERIAWELDRLGAFRDEEELLRATLPWTEERSRARAALEQQLGILAQRRGALDEAAEHLERSRALDEELGDHVGLARSLAQLAVLSQLAGDLASAERRLGQAHRLARSAEDPDLMAATQHQLGVQSELGGDLDEAAARLMHAIELRESAADPAGTARTLEALGRVEGERGRYGESEDRLRRALALGEVLGDDAARARLLRALADLALRQGEPMEADRLLRDALAIEELRGDPSTLSATCVELGRAAVARDEHEEALEWSRRALALAEEEGDRAAVAAGYEQLAEVAERRGHPRDALRWSVQAVGVHLTIESPGTTASIRTLARLARSIGGRRWQDAWRHAHGVDPPPDLVAAVESAWWQRLLRATGVQNAGSSRT